MIDPEKLNDLEFEDQKEIRVKYKSEDLSDLKSIDVAKVSIQLIQDGNTMGTTDDVEELQLDFEYQLPGEEPFIVFKTNGWSVDSLDEFKKQIEKIIRNLQEKSKLNKLD